MTEASASRSQPCPSCGNDASGNFCQHCGAPLGGRFCTECGAPLDPGARFCNQCGAPAPGTQRPPAPSPPTVASRGGGSGPAGASRSSRTADGGGGRPRGRQPRPAPDTLAGNQLAWWVAGISLLVVIMVVGWSMVRPGPGPAPAGGMSGGGGVNPNGPGVTDITQMTPREAADRLFDRVMRTISAGDTAAALGFQPMAVQAYQRAEPLDADGLFHQSLLELLTDPPAALATAKRILEMDPDHILGLGAAAEAARAMGDDEAAAEFYRHLLEAYDAQAARSLPEYEGHSGLLSAYRAEAEAFLASR